MDAPPRTAKTTITMLYLILFASLAVCGYLGHLNWQAVNDRVELAKRVQEYLDRQKERLNY